MMRRAGRWRRSRCRPRSASMRSCAGRRCRARAAITGEQISTSSTARRFRPGIAYSSIAQEYDPLGPFGPLARVARGERRPFRVLPAVSRRAVGGSAGALAFQLRAARRAGAAGALRRGVARRVARCAARRQGLGARAARGAARSVTSCASIGLEDAVADGGGLAAQAHIVLSRFTISPRTCPSSAPGLVNKGGFRRRSRQRSARRIRCR